MAHIDIMDGGSSSSNSNSESSPDMTPSGPGAANPPTTSSKSPKAGARVFFHLAQVGCCLLTIQHCCHQQIDQYFASGVVEVDRPELSRSCDDAL
jgi:hypothetical protein